MPVSDAPHLPQRSCRCRRKAAQRVRVAQEREMSGYRVVAGVLSPVTTRAEPDSVQEASTSQVGFDGVATHIRAAVALLGKRAACKYQDAPFWRHRPVVVN